MTTYLLTGGAGFIGHHVAEHLLRKTSDAHIVFLDRLDCSGNLNRLPEIAGWADYKKRCRWVWHDLKAPLSSQVVAQIGTVDVVLHLAAGTHVDRSIEDPLSFVYDNVVGTANLLEYARRVQPQRFVYFSTDEVFGPAARDDGLKGPNIGPMVCEWDKVPDGPLAGCAVNVLPHKLPVYREWDRYRSANPYAATKAGAEELCLAYENTYGVPVLVTHCMNVFGERQHPEKFIPMTIANVRDGQTVTIHADKTRTKAGSRFYIHARNVADGLLFVLKNGTVGDKYNIVGEVEVDNLKLAYLIAKNVGNELHAEMVDFHSSRPGHDLRYALDGSKLASMGWKPPVSFEDSLRRVVQWTLNNPRWLLK